MGLLRTNLAFVSRPMAYYRCIFLLFCYNKGVDVFLLLWCFFFFNLYSSVFTLVIMETISFACVSHSFVIGYRSVSDSVM